MNFLRLSSRVRYVSLPTHIYKMLEGQGTLSWLVAGSQGGEVGEVDGPWRPPFIFGQNFF